MSISPVQGPSVCLPPPPVSVSSAITKIALKCLAELAVSLALGFTVAYFAAPPATASLILAATAIQFAVGTVFHSLGALAQSGKLLSLCEWITGCGFATLTGFNTQMLIHETGHALAAFSLYKRSRPQIFVHPFIGGSTEFCKTSLSSLGKKLGPAATTCAVIASGPALSLLVSSVLLTMGLAMRDRHPHLSKYLMAQSVLDFFYHANYAYSALRTDAWKLSHDFVHLSIFGLDPRVATVGILAIPTIIMLGMNWGRSKERPV